MASNGGGSVHDGMSIVANVCCLLAISKDLLRILQLFFLKSVNTQLQHSRSLITECLHFSSLLIISEAPKCYENEVKKSKRTSKRIGSHHFSKAVNFKSRGAW